MGSKRAHEVYRTYSRSNIRRLVSRTALNKLGELGTVRSFLWDARGDMIFPLATEPKAAAELWSSRKYQDQVAKIIAKFPFGKDCCDLKRASLALTNGDIFWSYIHEQGKRTVPGISGVFPT